jgi:hypothetical protein
VAIDIPGLGFDAHYSPWPLELKRDFLPHKTHDLPRMASLCSASCTWLLVSAFSLDIDLVCLTVSGVIPGNDEER